MIKLLPALLDLMTANQEAVGVQHVDIYRDTLDVENRLSSASLPALAILDRGERIARRGPMAGDATQELFVTLRLLHESVSNTHLRFDERRGVYEIVERLRGILWSDKSLNGTCISADPQVNGLELAYVRKVNAQAVGRYQVAVFDIELTYFRYVTWSSTRNDQRFTP